MCQGTILEKIIQAAVANQTIFFYGIGCLEANTLRKFSSLAFHKNSSILKILIFGKSEILSLWWILKSKDDVLVKKVLFFIFFYFFIDFILGFQIPCAQSRYKVL